MSQTHFAIADKPICKDRSKWRFVAERSVMPQEFDIIYLSETHPHLYKFITSPTGRRVAEGIPKNDQIYKDTCA